MNHHLPDKIIGNVFGLRSTAGPEESKRKTFTIHAQSSSQWARRDLNKNSFESKDEVSAVSIT
jgi:hypothetical protein